MGPTISIIVELPQMHNLVDRSGIGLEVSDGYGGHGGGPSLARLLRCPSGGAIVQTARLRRDQGKRGEARELLAPGYGWFTETRDLKEATALLNELCASR